MHTSSPSLQSSLNQPTFQIKIAKKLSFTFFFQPSSPPFPSLAYPCCFHLLTYTPSPCLLSFSQVSFFLSLKSALIPQNIYIFIHMSRATLSSTLQQHHWFFSSLWYLCFTFLCFKPSGKAELDYWRASTIKVQEEEAEEEEGSIWDGRKGLYLSHISPIWSFPLFR